MIPPKPSRRFSWQIPFIVILFALIIVVGYSYYGLGKSELVRQEHEKLNALAELKTKQLHDWLAERKGDASVSVEGVQIARALAGYIESRSGKDKGACLQWIETLKKAYHYRAALLVDADARTVLVSDLGETLGSQDAAAARQAMATGKITVSDLEGHDGVAPHLDFIAPLPGSGKKPPAGALVLRIDPAVYLYPALQSWPTPSPSGETLLVRRDGNDVLFLNELRHKKGTALTLRFPLSRADLPAAMAARGWEGIVEGHDYRGVKVLSALKAVPDSPWFLVAKVDVAEVYAPLRSRAIISALLSLLLFTATALLIRLMWRNREAEFLRTELQNQLKASAEIAASEENLAVTLASIGDGVIATDSEGRVTRMNQVAEQLTGWSLSAAHGRPLDEIFVIVNEATRLPVENPAHKVLETGRIIGLANHTALIARDGSESPIADSGAPIRDRNGNVLGVVLVFRDQTEDKRREREIINARDFYLTLFEEFPALIWRSGLDARSDYFNKTWLDFRGRSMEQELGDGWIEGVHPEDRERCSQAYLTAFNARKPFGLEYRLLHRDGGYRWVAVFGRPYCNQDGVFSGFIGSCYDITERKQATDSLRESEELLHKIFDASPDMIVVFDRDSRIIRSNWHGKFQDVPAETRERNPFCHEVLHKEQGCICAICPPIEVMRSGREFIAEKCLDDIGLFEHRFYPIYGDSGSVSLVVGYFRDITEQRNIEEQLRHSQKMEAIGTLAGGIAHDFNNILTAIIGFANLLKMKVSGESPLLDFVEKILDASDRAAALTHGLLAYSRRGELELRSLDINGIVKKVDQILSRIIGEDVELTIIPADGELTVLADAGQVEQVLMNLATNARDAMLGGGMLHIRVTETAIDKGFITTHGYGEIGRYALLSVSDTGAGMDKTTRQRIFEPFFTTKEVGKGTGLGLSIVYGIVKQHKGFINVYSEPGKGTTFRIYFPLTEVVPVNAQLMQHIPERGNGETILLIEDNEDIRNFLCEMLKDYGYKVIEAEDGVKAVEKFLAQRNMIDILLLDVVMPRKNGKETYDEIRSIEPGVVALFMSGYTADIISAKGIDTEGLEFVSKPFTPFALLMKIRELLDRSRKKNV